MGSVCIGLRSRLHLQSPVGRVQRNQMLQRVFSKKGLPQDCRAGHAHSWSHSERKQMRSSPFPFQPWAKKACPSLGRVPSGWEISVSGEKLPHCRTCWAVAKPSPASADSSPGLFPPLCAVCSVTPCFIHLASGSTQPQLPLGRLHVADPPALITGCSWQGFFVARRPLLRISHTQWARRGGSGTLGDTFPNCHTYLLVYPVKWRRLH